jgi:hypothetical protein
MAILQFTACLMMFLLAFNARSDQEQGARLVLFGMFSLLGTNGRFGHVRSTLIITRPNPHQPHHLLSPSLANSSALAHRRRRCRTFPGPAPPLSARALTPPHPPPSHGGVLLDSEHFKSLMINFALVAMCATALRSTNGKLSLLTKRGGILPRNRADFAVFVHVACFIYWKFDSTTFELSRAVSTPNYVPTPFFWELAGWIVNAIDCTCPS